MESQQSNIDVMGWTRRVGGLAMAVLLTLLVGCSQDFDGDDTAARSLNEAGKSLYAKECASCHGGSGAGGSGGPLVGCASCGSTDSLMAKIKKDMPSAGSPLRGQNAQDVAEYVFVAFNESTRGTVDRAIPGVATLTPSEAVYKLAFELAGRLPEPEEITRFSESLEGEREVVAGFMEEDYFYERLKDVFNDSFQTDEYRRTNGGRPDEVYNRDVNDNDNQNIFDGMDWYDRVLDPDNNDMADFPLSEGYLRHFSDEALSRKPLLFVEFLARNDRDFRELVSGKYTVANAFSWHAFAGDTDRPNIRSVDPDASAGNGALPVLPEPEWDSWPNVESLNSYLDVADLVGRDTNGNSTRTNGNLTAQYVMEAFPYDPRDIRAVQLYYNDVGGNVKNSGVPHSGVLTDLVFLNKFTAMDTNRHRHRARMVYWFFGGKDLLAIEGNRDVAALELDEASNESVGIVDPTKTNSDCIVCHKIMDPVAEAFSHFRLDGVYQTDEELDVLDQGEVPLTPGVQVGWSQFGAGYDEFSTSNNYNGREVQWLGETIAQDAAYARGISQIVVRGLIGQPIMGTPNPDSPQAYRDAYAQQARLITNAASEFSASGYDIKELVFAITKSGYYRARGLYQPGMSDQYDSLGTSRLIPAHLLNQKLRAINSGGWRSTVNLYSRTGRRFMGGKDSREVMEDADSASGIIATLTQAMAVEESCDVVRNEFRETRSERNLFRLVETSTDLESDSGINRRSEALAIRTTIQSLYLALLHEEVELDSEDVDIAFELFRTVVTEEIESGCNVSSNAEHAWFAVLVYLMNDYRFIYG
ncbi:c-type cytochrome [Saccharospirillum impatiens]|uniref:c-type cytochrome n=1 Tax=Saccharospirillum impatiens TaxID=169438 RepID=UPI00048CE8AB|nr:cytochrome c [Saccharospirillum impatiens]